MSYQDPFGPDCPAGFTEHALFPGQEPVRVNPAHGTWITELPATFDIIWATFWNEDANRLLAPLLRIDDAHPPQARAWSQSRQPPTRLITTEPAAGLTRAHVRQALGRARSLTACRAGTASARPTSSSPATKHGWT